MVTAFILMNVERQRIKAAAQEIQQIKGIKEVYSVAGDYDLVAVARVRKNEAIADLVTEQLIEVDGITNTNTLISFRQYTDYDLEKMFEVTW
jgi:DNA-binding Lrp family transcriptional regulator